MDVALVFSEGPDFKHIGNLVKSGLSNQVGYKDSNKIHNSDVLNWWNNWLPKGFIVTGRGFWNQCDRLAGLFTKQNKTLHI